MSEYQNNGHELGWDEGIQDDSGAFLLLEDGDYNFEVTNFERGRFPGSAKLPACNKAVLTLRVDTTKGSASVKYDLILFSTLEWKISAFFRAIGQKKHGEKIVPNWNTVVGAKGRAKFKQRTYTKDGEEKQANDIADFYDYDPAFFAAGNDWTKQADAAPAAPQSVMNGYQTSTPAFTPGKF